MNSKIEEMINDPRTSIKDLVSEVEKLERNKVSDQLKIVGDTTSAEELVLEIQLMIKGIKGSAYFMAAIMACVAFTVGVIVSENGWV